MHWKNKDKRCHDSGSNPAPGNIGREPSHDEERTEVAIKRELAKAMVDELIHMSVVLVTANSGTGKGQKALGRPVKALTRTTRHN